MMYRYIAAAFVGEMLADFGGWLWYTTPGFWCVLDVVGFVLALVVILTDEVKA